MRRLPALIVCLFCLSAAWAAPQADLRAVGLLPVFSPGMNRALFSRQMDEMLTGLSVSGVWQATVLDAESALVRAAAAQWPEPSPADWTQAGEQLQTLATQLRLSELLVVLPGADHQSLQVLWVEPGVTQMRTFSLPTDTAGGLGRGLNDRLAAGFAGATAVAVAQAPGVGPAVRPTPTAGTSSAPTPLTAPTTSPSSAPGLAQPTPSISQPSAMPAGTTGPAISQPGGEPLPGIKPPTVTAAVIPQPTNTGGAPVTTSAPVRDNDTGPRPVASAPTFTAPTTPGATTPALTTVAPGGAPTVVDLPPTRPGSEPLPGTTTTPPATPVTGTVSTPGAGPVATSGLNRTAGLTPLPAGGMTGPTATTTPVTPKVAASRPQATGPATVASTSPASEPLPGAVAGNPKPTMVAATIPGQAGAPVATTAPVTNTPGPTPLPTGGAAPTASAPGPSAPDLTGSRPQTTGPATVPSSHPVGEPLPTTTPATAKPPTTPAISPEILKARQALQDGDTSLAESWADRALKVGEPRTSVFLLYAQIAAAQHNNAGERRWLERALALDEKLVEPRVRLADLLRQDGLWQRALTEYGQALTVDRGSLYASLGMARIYADHGQARRAAEILSEAAQAHPDNTDLLLKLGDMQAKREAWTEAEEAYDRAARLSKGAERADALDRLGDLYVRAKRFQEGFICYAEASRLRGGTASSLADKRYVQVLSVADQAVFAGLERISKKFAAYVGGEDVTREETYQALQEYSGQVQEVLGFAQSIVAPATMKVSHAQRKLLYNLAREAAVEAMVYLDRGDRSVLDDYAKHLGEIQAGLETLRQATP